MEHDIFNLVEEKNVLLSIIDDLREQVRGLREGQMAVGNDDVTIEVGNNEYNLNDNTSMQSKLQDYVDRYLSQEKILDQERRNKTILNQELIQKNT